MESLYYPYFRGKQFELITIRECAGMMKDARICPIIEPVRESLKGLQRAIDALHQVQAPFILIGNPKLGDHAGDILGTLRPVIEKAIENGVDFSLGILVTATPDDESVRVLLETYQASAISVIHRGMASAETLRLIESSSSLLKEHIFIEGSSKIYQKTFKGKKRVLVHDGFHKRKNKDYPDEEFFTELHLIYDEVGMDGFGDFLIVGDEYSEAGGPAYAVAIHLTYFDRDNQNVMMIRHFKSDRNETPTDPGGKYLEALAKMIDFLDSANPPIFQTSAINEFRRHHVEQYFPGLGYVKRLSMTHHLEMFANFLTAEQG